MTLDFALRGLLQLPEIHLFTFIKGNLGRAATLKFKAQHGLFKYLLLQLGTIPSFDARYFTVSTGVHGVFDQALCTIAFRIFPYD